MKKIAITGNMGTGKSAFVALFAQDNFPIFNSDEVVAELYENNLAMQHELKSLYQGISSHKWLRKKDVALWVQQHPEKLPMIEQIVLKYLSQEQQYFIQKHHAAAALIFEIPLLFENHLQAFYDKVILLYAPQEIRWERVKNRQGMTPEKFNLFLQRQIDYNIVRDQADITIDTGQDWENIVEIYQQLVKNGFNAIG